MPTTNRIDKVNSLLEHEIGQIILRDFDFSDCLVTLTHVDTTSNLIEAKVYISVIALPSDKMSKQNEEILGEKSEERGGLPSGKPTSDSDFAGKISNLGASSYLKAGLKPEDKIEAIVKILNNNVRDVQQKINKKLNMRPIPKIKFVKDENIKEAARIEAILNKIETEEKG